MRSRSIGEALDIRRRILGAENPDVAWTLNDLGVLYKEQGRYAEAESLYIQVREIVLAFVYASKAHGEVSASQACAAGPHSVDFRGKLFNPRKYLL